jgi:hypothetical protein
MTLHIEGFPKSGNTFLKYAGERFFGFTPAIVSHTVSKIKLAVELNEPIFITLRDPIDSIASFIHFKGDTDSPKIERYTGYYERLYETVCLNKEHVFLAPFKDIVFDVNAVLIEGAKKFNISDYTPIDHVSVYEDMKNNSQFNMFLPGDRDYFYLKARDIVGAADINTFSKCYDLYYELLEGTLT